MHVYFSLVVIVFSVDWIVALVHLVLMWRFEAILLTMVFIEESWVSRSCWVPVSEL